MRKYLNIFILSLFTISAFAQDLSQLHVIGKGEYLPSELISKDRRDSNGEVCAAIMINTDLDGLSYDAYNGVVKVNSKPGRNFVFVSPSERVVEVFKSGYEPLKIILNDYNIILKSGQVWQVIITGDKIASDLIPVSIISNVEDATFYIDSVNKGSGRIHKLSTGSHKLRVVKEGYESVTKYIDVDESNADFSFTLIENDSEEFDVKSISTDVKNNCLQKVQYGNKIYTTVLIGKQCWMAENLNIGKSIPKVSRRDEQTDNSIMEKFCYENIEANCDKYGGLYQWNEAMQYSTEDGNKGICPTGWHIPTLGEFTILKDAIGGKINELKHLVEKSQERKTSGFNALFAGCFENDSNYFNGLNYNTTFWSSTKSSSTHAGYVSMNSSDDNIYFYLQRKNFGYSIRCLKD